MNHVPGDLDPICFTCFSALFDPPVEARYSGGSVILEKRVENFQAAELTRKLKALPRARKIMRLSVSFFQWVFVEEKIIMTRSDTNSGNTSHVENTVHDRKQVAVKFLQLVVAGQIEEAYRNYVDLRGKHHNLSFPAGFPALQKAMIENHVQFPSKQLTVKNLVGEGDLVAVHSHIVLRPGETGIAVVHLFRFHDDKIVEMWDCGQPVQADSLNENGAF